MFGKPWKSRQRTFHFGNVLHDLLHVDRLNTTNNCSYTFKILKCT